MTDISMAAAKFFVNKEKRVVVCVLEDTADMFRDYVDEKLFISTTCDEEAVFRDTESFRGKLYHQLFMPNRFVGIARCAPEDEWNEHVGKMIAYQRARKKLYKSFFKRANYYMYVLDTYLDKTEELLNDFGKHISESDAYLSEVIADFLNEEESNEDFR